MVIYIRVLRCFENRVSTDSACWWTVLVFVQVHSVAWNCTGKKLASGSVDQTARIWHIEPHGHVWTLFLDDRHKCTLCFLILWLVTSFLINRRVTWEQSKAKDMELKGHTDSVDQLCWDPKHADLLATASGDKTVRLWDARSEYLSMYSLALPPSCAFMSYSTFSVLFYFLGFIVVIAFD